MNKVDWSDVVHFEMHPLCREYLEKMEKGLTGPYCKRCQKRWFYEYGIDHALLDAPRVNIAGEEGGD